jgi:MerR family transcriptional regulator, thiopeptide resistance regulator
VSADPKRYRAKEFAKLAGVTVRTLHLYDRLGLLRAQRTHNGYRAYRDSDLERLEQIVALKFIGLPLKQIKRLLDHDGLELPEALSRQRSLLEMKRCLLDKAIAAIRQAEHAIVPGRRPDGAVLTRIIEVMEMHNDTDWMMKYFSDTAKPRLDELRQMWSPDLQERVSNDWRELIKDVEAALGGREDPTGAKGLALAARWIHLVEEFTGGHPDMIRGVKSLYSDRANWPSEFKDQMQAFHIRSAVWDFITKGVVELKRRQQ